MQQELKFLKVTEYINFEKVQENRIVSCKTVKYQESLYMSEFSIYLKFVILKFRSWLYFEV